jgi:hypothetical protein
VTDLLDANVLIAASVLEHEHHERVTTWAGTLGGFAVCPLVEGALVRFLVRVGEPACAVRDVLRRLRTRPGYEFWGDSVSYADVELAHVRGHRQVTDAYLLGLVRQHPSARLATMDEGLVQQSGGDAFVIPRT